MAMGLLYLVGSLTAETVAVSDAWPWREVVPPFRFVESGYCQEPALHALKSG